MSTFPESLSSRELFWLWYDRLTPEQRKDAANDFNRFVAQVELEANLQEVLLNKLLPMHNAGWEDTWRF